MAVHIFLVDEKNYHICLERGIVALPETKRENQSFDALLSRLASIKEDDYIMLYIIEPVKELHGVWKADGLPFFDEEPIWKDRVYPFRCRIKPSEFSFRNPLKLNDISDLCNTGALWTWAPKRPGGVYSNSMFSMTDNEFHILIDEFIKINPFSTETWRINRPYPFHENNIISHIHFKDNGKLAYESSLMTQLILAFNNKQYREIFGNYDSFLSYIPTSLGTEMDFLLMYNRPASNTVLSYDIIEVKRDKFTKDGLRQLIEYESWFLQKKVAGDQKMLRVSAIAESFADDVIDYVEKRTQIEGKRIKLLQYSVSSPLFIKLSEVN